MVATPVALTTFGLFLLIVAIILPVLGGIALLRRSRGHRLPYPSCGKCGYDVSATLGTAVRCPECGGEFAVVGITPPSGKRSPTMLWIGALLVILPLTCVGGLFALRLAASQRRAMAVPAVQAVPAQTVPNPTSAATTNTTAPDQP